MTTDSLQSFISTWRNLAERSLDDLQTIDLETNDMKKPIKAVYTHGWKIVDGDGIVMAADEPHDFYFGDVPPEKVADIEELFAVSIPAHVQRITQGWADEADEAEEESGGNPEKKREIMRNRAKARREERKKGRARG